MCIRRTGVRTGLAEVEILFVSQCLAGGPIRYPIALILVDLLDALDDRYRRTQCAEDLGRHAVVAGQHRLQRQAGQQRQT